MPEIDSEAVRAQYRYELLTWPEINEAVRQEKVIRAPCRLGGATRASPAP